MFRVSFTLFIVHGDVLVLTLFHTAWREGACDAVRRYWLIAKNRRSLLVTTARRVPVDVWNIAEVKIMTYNNIIAPHLARYALFLVPIPVLQFPPPLPFALYRFPNRTSHHRASHQSSIPRLSAPSGSFKRIPTSGLHSAPPRFSTAALRSNIINIVDFPSGTLTYAANGSSL